MYFFAPSCSKIFHYNCYLKIPLFPRMAEAICLTEGFIGNVVHQYYENVKLPGGAVTLTLCRRRYKICPAYGICGDFQLRFLTNFNDVANCHCLSGVWKATGSVRGGSAIVNGVAYGNSIRT